MFPFDFYYYDYGLMFIKLMKNDFLEWLENLFL